MQTMPPALEVNDLTVAYRDKPVLWDVDLQVPTGVLMAVVGPNGAGKTTLIKSVMGLMQPAAGSVQVFGGPAGRQPVRRIGYVPQRTSVDWDFPTSVRDVVAMGRYNRGGLWRRTDRRDAERVARALATVDMEDLADRQISELSGGQQQRVFLARALVQDSDLYLMDEPFQGVDAVTEQSMVAVLRRLQTQGRTVLAVHHDLRTAPAYFDWVALLNVRLIASGPMATTFSECNLRETFGGSAPAWANPPATTAA